MLASSENRPRTRRLRRRKKEEKEGGNNFILPPLSPFPGAVIETITILYSFHDFVRS